MQILEGIQVKTFLKTASCTVLLFATCQRFSEIRLLAALYPDNDLSGNTGEAAGPAPGRSTVLAE